MHGVMKTAGNADDGQADGRQKVLADVGEDVIVRMLTGVLPGHVGTKGRFRTIVGPGDDCAVLRSPDASRVLLLKTDCVVEGVHYAAAAPPSKVGRKALARPLSDIAAMGGEPHAALVTLVAPSARPLAYVRALYRGLSALAEETGVAVVGGETSSSPAPGSGGGFAMLSVALLGSALADRYALRSGASPGDRVVVTGRLGGSIRGRHLTFPPRLKEGRWLVRNRFATAMMDISDGLAKDAVRLGAASGVEVVIEPGRVPRNRGCSAEQAMGDGEDYELLFTVAAGRMAELVRRWRRTFPDVPLTEVGSVGSLGKGGRKSAGGGWEHFAPTGGRPQRKSKR